MLSLDLWLISPRPNCRTSLESAFRLSGNALSLIQGIGRAFKPLIFSIFDLNIEYTRIFRNPCSLTIPRIPPRSFLYQFKLGKTYGQVDAAMR